MIGTVAELHSNARPLCLQSLPVHSTSTLQLLNVCPKPCGSSHELRQCQNRGRAHQVLHHSAVVTPILAIAVAIAGGEAFDQLCRNAIIVEHNVLPLLCL